VKKVKIDCDEMYPCFYLSEYAGLESMITDQDWEDYLEVEKRFEEWQARLARLYDAAEKDSKGR